MLTITARVPGEAAAARLWPLHSKCCLSPMAVTVAPLPLAFLCTCPACVCVTIYASLLEDMGSLRNPAAFNNVYGFRPTATSNTVPSSSAEIFFQTESTDGPMGRSVEDVFLLLSVLAGPADGQWGFSRPRDPRLDLSLPAFIALSNSLDLSRVRVGWLGDLNKYLPFEDGVLQLSEGTVKRVIGGAMGCVVDFDAADKLGFDMKRLWSAFVVLRHFLVMGRMKAHYDHPERRFVICVCGCVGV